MNDTYYVNRLKITDRKGNEREAVELMGELKLYPQIMLLPEAMEDDVKLLRYIAESVIETEQWCENARHCADYIEVDGIEHKVEELIEKHEIQI
jgi:hypothetical protein